MWKERLKLIFSLFIAELLSHHKVSIQLRAVFGLVQPAVPLVECMGVGDSPWWNQKKEVGGAPKSPWGYWFVSWCKHLSCFMLAALRLLHLQTKAAFVTPPGARVSKGPEYNTRQRTAISHPRLALMPSGWKVETLPRDGCGHWFCLFSPPKQMIQTHRHHEIFKLADGTKFYRERHATWMAAGRALASLLMGRNVVDAFQWEEVSGSACRQKPPGAGGEGALGHWQRPETEVWRCWAGVLGTI